LRVDLVMRKDTLVVRLHGELDLVVADEFRTGVDRELERRSVRNLVLNLEGVSFIDSSGLGAIIGRYKRISRQGGKVIITRAKPQVKRILELSGLMKIIGMSASEAEALRKLNSGGSKEAAE
jgi:stage II sporulation protein AA (anti-sigma F factor antagonist)